MLASPKGEVSVREILFGGFALILAGCAGPMMVANGASDQQQTAATSTEEREPPPPPQLRQPARRGWGGNIYRGRYAY